MLGAAKRVLLGLTLLWPLSAAAEDPPQAPRLAQYIQSRRLQFDLVQGRVKFATTYSGSTSSRSSSGSHKEQLSMRMSGNSATVDYELSSSTETLSIKVQGDTHLQIQRVPQGSSSIVPVTFVQAAGKPLSLVVGPEGEQQTYEAPSLWHLLLEEPKLVQQRLVPLVELLRPGSNLADKVAEVERKMLETAETETMPDRKRWMELVDQLGDDSFARRQAADRQLRQAGQAVLVYLRNLDRRELDAEQQFRIHRIIRSFARSQQSDDPQVVAQWLGSDSRAWLILLGRDEPATRQLAARRLEWLLGEPIAFDPSADPATRQRQIEQLRKRVVPQG